MGLKSKHLLETTARPDHRGRITLGPNLTKGISRYDVYVNKESGEVLLRPFKEIPAKEAWLYENKLAKEKVVKGLEAAKNMKFSQVEFKAENWINKIEDDE